MTIVLDRVTRQVGRDLHLHPISLALEPGAMTVLLGPTLAGKTSLMRIMAGLDRPSSGTVTAGGRDVTGLDVRRRSVAMVYQQFINYPSMTVYDNIASPLRVQRQGKAEIDRSVRQAAEMMRIGHLLGRLPAELSGGQQQRTAIARSLVREVDLLLLDEPLVNLDYKLREELRAEMRDIFSRGKTTVIYATTEPMEALMLGGATVVLDQGRLLQTGPTAEVYHHPDSIRVGEVFSDPPMNLLPGMILNGGRAVLGEVTFPLPDHLRRLGPGPCRFGVRANHIGTAGPGGTGADGAITLACTVDLAEISGSETFVHGRHGDLVMVVQMKGVAQFRIGDTVTLCLDPDRLYAFDAAGALAAAPLRRTALVHGAA